MMPIIQRLRWLVLAAFSLPLLAGTASAQSTRAGETVFQVTPYVWAAGLGGDIRPFAGGPTASVDKSFSDLLGDLDAAFFVSGYARHGNLVFLGDISTSSSSRSGVLPSPPAPASLPAEARVRQTSLTLAAGYRVVSTPAATLDLLAGARHWRIRGEVTAPAVPPVFAGAQVSRSRNFTDPIVGLRANLRLAPDWSLLLYGDAGGFGVGSRSTAQLLATVNYQVTDSLFLSAGYRHLHVDYRSGGTRFDLQMSGPLVGATLRF